MSSSLLQSILCLFPRAVFLLFNFISSRHMRTHNSWDSETISDDGSITILANVFFCYYQKLLSGAVNMDKFGWLINQTKPSKQWEFCNYLLYKSVVSRGCQSGSIGQSGPGGPGLPGGPGGSRLSKWSRWSRWSGLMIAIQKIYGPSH